MHTVPARPDKTTDPAPPAPYFRVLPPPDWAVIDAYRLTLPAPA